MQPFPATRDSRIIYNSLEYILFYNIQEGDREKNQRASWYVDTPDVEAKDLMKHCINLSTEQNSVFNPNTGKYGPEITPYLDTFPAVTVVFMF